jgi:predicted NACHT family NTPase
MSQRRADNPVDLFSIYVETLLRSGSRTVRDNKLVEELRKSAALIVIGSAGAGKTMFIRYLFLQMVEGNFGVIPIFLELRGVNSTEYKDNLIQFIHESIVRPGAVVTKNQFDACLRENMFTLILDGLDEVDHDSRPAVERQIANLREAYPDLGIVITSRPDDRLASWGEF